MLELDKIIMKYSPSNIFDGNTQGLTYFYTVSFTVWLIKLVWSTLLILMHHLFSSDNVDTNSAPKYWDRIKWSQGTVLQKMMMETHKDWPTFTLYLLRYDWESEPGALC